MPMRTHELMSHIVNVDHGTLSCKIKLASPLNLKLNLLDTQNSDIILIKVI